MWFMHTRACTHTQTRHTNTFTHTKQHTNTQIACIGSEGQVVQDKVGKLTSFLVPFCFLQYFIDSGQASVTCNGYDIETHEDGGFFGEMAFLATIYSLLTSDLPDEKVDTDNLLMRLGLANLSELRMTRSATVKAKVRCECMELNAGSFLTTLLDDITSFTAALR